LDSLTDFYKGEDEKNLNNGNDWAKYITFAWTIITLVQQMVLIFKEDKKEENMKKYMEIFTQRAINEENEKMKNKYFCEISKDGNFDIIINKINNDNNSQVKYQSYFSKYVINIPNVDETSLVANHIYSAIFSKMDEEFVVLVMVIFIAIENSNRKKLLKFIQISVIISIIIPLYNFYYPENTIKNLNLYFFITNALLAIYNIFNFNLKNKNQKRAFISVINEIFISKGYFINMNDDIISIFALKDEYIFNNNIKRIADIDERKCNLLLP
jgi:K+-sensing histidine kinase KdpD